MRCAVLAMVLAAAPIWAPVRAMDRLTPVLDADRARIAGGWFGHLSVALPLDTWPPYAVGVLTAPPRLVVRLDAPLGVTGKLPDGLSVRQGSDASELVLALRQPMLPGRVALDWQEEGAGILRLDLDRVDAETFLAAAQRWPQPDPQAETRETAPGREGKLRVVIDPGHGGTDPGAEHGGLREADVTLQMARDLARELEGAGMDVTLTREDDSFVPLTERVGRATRAGADLFLSLHADALLAGHASGASVHSLPPSSGESGDAYMLTRLGDHALASTGGPVADAVARTLMDLARDQTVAAADSLAADLVAAMAGADIPLYKTPRKTSNFVVLRSADMPSVLIELGYLSEQADRAHLADPAWRGRMARALAQGIAAWALSRPDPGR